MAAVDDGDPPLPPEHTQALAFGCGTIGAGNESKHPDASFIFIPKHPGTQTYVCNTNSTMTPRKQYDRYPHLPQPHPTLTASPANYHRTSTSVISMISPARRNLCLHLSPTTAAKMQTPQKRLCYPQPPTSH